MLALGHLRHHRRIVTLSVVASLTPCAVSGCFPTLSHAGLPQLHFPALAHWRGRTGQPLRAARRADFIREKRALSTSCCPHNYANRPFQDRFLRLLLIAEFVRFLMQWENVRLMGKTHRWQTRWLRKYSLGPYAFQNRMEKRLRREVHLANFSLEMKEELIRLEQPLPETTITWLYEACLRARSEKATVEVAQRIFGSKVWKRGEQERKNLRTLLKVFAEYDADSKMRKALGVRKDSRMSRRATRLARDLIEFGEQCRFWKPFAACSAWHKDYRELCACWTHVSEEDIPML